MTKHKLYANGDTIGFVCGAILSKVSGSAKWKNVNCTNCLNVRKARKAKLKKWVKENG